MCGGLSSRMGRDKGLLLYEGKTWAEIAYDRLTGLCSEVFVSIRSEQSAEYGRVFDSSLLVEDSRFDVEGPMRGILSAFDRMPADYLVLACDLPRMTSAALAEILRARAASGAECAAFETDRAEPLCAYYGERALLDLSGSPGSDFSLERFLRQRHTVFVPAGEFAEELRNYNTPGP